MGIVLNFIKMMIVKYFSTAVMEKIVIWGLGILVKQTKSKADDELYQIVFGQLKGENKNVGES